MDLNNKNIKKIMLIIISTIAIITVFNNYRSVISLLEKIIIFVRPVIIALCIAFVLNVLLTALESNVFIFMDKSKFMFIRKSKRPLCLILTYLIALGIITVLIVVILPDISETVISLAERLPDFMNQVKLWAENSMERINLSQNFIPNITINWTSFANSIIDYVKGDSNKIFGNAVNITTSVVTAAYEIFFSILISVYILAQKEKIGNFVKKIITAYFPIKAEEKIYYISAKTYSLFAKFIGGQLTESVILGILCFIGMTIFRFPNAPIISIFIAVTSLIPIIGATVGVIIGFLLIVITNPVKAFLFIAFFVALQQLEGYLIYPKVVGKSVGLPGVIVICAVLIGGNMGGIIGALISVPTAAVLFVLIKESIAKQIEKKNKSLP